MLFFPKLFLLQNISLYASVVLHFTSEVIRYSTESSDLLCYIRLHSPHPHLLISLRIISVNKYLHMNAESVGERRDFDIGSVSSFLFVVRALLSNDFWEREFWLLGVPNQRSSDDDFTFTKRFALTGGYLNIDYWTLTPLLNYLPTQFFHLTSFTIAWLTEPFKVAFFGGVSTVKLGWMEAGVWHFEPARLRLTCSVCSYSFKSLFLLYILSVLLVVSCFFTRSALSCCRAVRHYLG